MNTLKDERNLKNYVAPSLEQVDFKVSDAISSTSLQDVNAGDLFG